MSVYKENGFTVQNILGALHTHAKRKCEDGAVDQHDMHCAKKRRDSHDCSSPSLEECDTETSTTSSSNCESKESKQSPGCNGEDAQPHKVAKKHSRALEALFSIAGNRDSGAATVLVNTKREYVIIKPSDIQQNPYDKITGPHRASSRSHIPSRSTAPHSTYDLLECSTTLAPVLLRYKFLFEEQLPLLSPKNTTALATLECIWRYHDTFNIQDDTIATTIRALEVAQSALGLQHKSTLSILNYLTNHFTNTDPSPPRAEHYLRLTLQGYSQTANHKATAETYHALSKIYLNRNDDVSAECTLLRIISTLLPIEDWRHPMILWTMYHYGWICLRSGCCHCAKEWFMKAWEGYSQTHGPQGHVTIWIKYEVAMVQAMLGENQLAEVWAREAYEGFMSICGERSDSACEAARMLARIYRASGKEERAVGIEEWLRAQDEWDSEEDEDDGNDTGRSPDFEAPEGWDKSEAVETRWLPEEVVEKSTSKAANNEDLPSPEAGGTECGKPVPEAEVQDNRKPTSKVMESVRHSRVAQVVKETMSKRFAAAKEQHARESVVTNMELPMPDTTAPGTKQNTPQATVPEKRVSTPETPEKVSEHTTPEKITKHNTPEATLRSLPTPQSTMRGQPAPPASMYNQPTPDATEPEPTPEPDKADNL
ncbi:hypothetical protein K470DRAFT_265201 [Piedraia hortae CBS 480.64]|uniref:Uncharacterized protein n=1 Tax=Piedraia hortae CBS 480.64 TaxID=1314780 RepID=A0A6A7BW85_9PEZI|nr:hypothetical protein K470DRAFT_265201 [Piedraia hortae CBS 480.64]